MNIGKDIREAVIKYSDMLYKICIVILCNEQDVQDAMQNYLSLVKQHVI